MGKVTAKIFEFLATFILDDSDGTKMVGPWKISPSPVCLVIKVLYYYPFVLTRLFFLTNYCSLFTHKREGAAATAKALKLPECRNATARGYSISFLIL